MIAVTMCGRVCFGSRKISLSTVFAGQNVGVREVAALRGESLRSPACEPVFLPG